MKPNIIGISGKIGSGKDTVAKIIQLLTMGCANEDIPRIIEENMTFPVPFDTPWEIKKFATKLKQVVSLFTGIPVGQLEKEEVKSLVLPKEWQVYEIYDKDILISKYFVDEEGAINYCDPRTSSYHTFTYKESQRTVRWLLQNIGTDCFRDKIHPNMHVNGLFANYNPGLIARNNAKELLRSTDTDLPSKWLIPDTRFPNEGTAIKIRDGIILKVNRHKRLDSSALYELAMDRLDINNPNMDHAHTFAERLDLGYDEATEEWIDNNDLYRGKEHESETALDNWKFDHVIDNNGTILELVEKVKEVLIKEKLV